MHRAAVEACLPWLLTLVLACLLLWTLVRWSGAQIRLGRLLSLHRDERGAVQSLSFVLTVPAFAMIFMLIVQISQLMIGIMVVHYAAYATARAAIVWIPADTGGEEGENRISSYLPDNAGIPGTGEQYTIVPGSPKYQKIEMAAVLACMPLAPSRDLGLAVDGPERDALHRIYRGLDPAYETNSRIPARIDNKFAYAREATRIKLSFLHKDDGIEPPLAPWMVPPDIFEFYPNEVGWQDPIQVTVTHQFALLPGPGRLLAREVTSYDGRPDTVAASIFVRRGVYVRELTATATLGNEGLKSVAPYRHNLQTPSPPTSSPQSQSQAAAASHSGNRFISTNGRFESRQPWLAANGDCAALPFGVVEAGSPASQVADRSDIAIGGRFSGQSMLLGDLPIPLVATSP